MSVAKKLTKKLKDVELEITFAAPKEYDTAKGTDAGKGKHHKRKKPSPKKRTRLSGSKK